MSKRTFRGGLHPPERKDQTCAKQVVDIPLPPEVVVHLHQHTGAPCKPLVGKGDTVLAGQKIGDAEAFISAPVHSPVSGQVTAVEPRFHFTGVRLAAVVIKPDADQKEAKITVRGAGDPTPEETRKVVREAGIVGLGGAAFPTHVKISPPKDKPIDSVIINGCECEPFLTCDHRNLLEQADAIIDGMRLIASTVAAGNVYVAIEDNKRDAIDLLGRKAAAGGFKVVSLSARYPQGAEKQLIKTILAREIPSGKLPMDVGALVQNVGTAIAVSEAVRKGKPLIERTVTVAGSGIREPKNLRVKIGTPLEFLVQQCGGFAEDVAKVIMGGPMTGFSQFHMEVPVVKGTSGILAFSRADTFFEPPDHNPCIRCGRCVAACPMILMPNFIGIFARLEKWDVAEAYHVMDCIECGCCGYICPSRIPLVQLFKLAKAKVLAARQEKKWTAKS